MAPTLHPQEKVLVVKQWLLPVRMQNIVVAHDPRSRRLVVKRVKAIRAEKIFLVGDNANESTDSRKFGWIEKKSILGRVIFHKA